MADEECEFPEDWGPAAEDEEAELAAAPEEPEDADAADVAMEDEGAEAQEELSLEAEQVEELLIGDDDDDDDDDLAAAEAAALGKAQEELSLEAEQVEELLIGDDDDEEDDDDLAAAEAAALAALGCAGEGAEAEVDEAEADVEIDQEEEDFTPALHPAPRPLAKAPVAKTPLQRPLGVRPPLSIPKLHGGRPPIAKVPMVRPPWARGPTPPMGKGAVGKGFAPAGACKGMVTSKGFKDTKGSNGTWHGAVGPAFVPGQGKGFGAKGKPSLGAVFPAAGAALGKGLKGAGQKGASPRPLNQGVSPRPPVTGDGKGKAKGKGPAAVGLRVVALNKVGYWVTGAGINVQALARLKEVPQSDAEKILQDLEARASSVPNPSKFINSAVEARSCSGKGASGKGAGSVRPPRQEVPATTPASSAPAGKGVKRASPPLDSPPAKRIIVPAAAAAEKPQPHVEEEENADEELVQQLPPAVCTKVQDLRTRMEIGAAALRALASAEQRDALILLQALLAREKAGKPVADATRFIVGSLSKRAAAASSATSAKAPVAKAPIAKASVSKSPAKAPVAKAAIAKAPGPAAGGGRPPAVRQGLDFDQMAVQAKLQSLNKTGLWAGPHPLDEAALASLLRIDPGRAMEILEETEDSGAELKSPTAFVIAKIKEDPR